MSPTHRLHFYTVSSPPYRRKRLEPRYLTGVWLGGPDGDVIHKQLLCRRCSTEAATESELYGIQTQDGTVPKAETGPRAAPHAIHQQRLARVGFSWRIESYTKLDVMPRIRTQRRGGVGFAAIAESPIAGDSVRLSCHRRIVGIEAQRARARSCGRLADDHRGKKIIPDRTLARLAERRPLVVGPRA